MKPYLFRLEQECEHLAATEYIYEIGTFHYNWHRDLEILVILKGSVEVCTENKLFFLEEDDVILINSNEGHATFSKTPESVAFLFRLDPDFLEKYIPGYQYICFKLYPVVVDSRHARRFRVAANTIKAATIGGMFEQKRKRNA